MKMLTVAVAALALSGCANEFLGTDTIAQQTSYLLGGPVRISHRDYSGGVNTYYTATTLNDGVNHRCVINGGTVLSLGQTNAPSCRP